MTKVKRLSIPLLSFVSWDDPVRFRGRSLQTIQSATPLQDSARPALSLSLHSYGGASSVPSVHHIVPCWLADCAWSSWTWLQRSDKLRNLPVLSAANNVLINERALIFEGFIRYLSVFRSVAMVLISFWSKHGGRFSGANINCGALIGWSCSGFGAPFYDTGKSRQKTTTDERSPLAFFTIKYDFVSPGE